MLVHACAQLAGYPDASKSARACNAGHDTDVRALQSWPHGGVCHFESAGRYLGSETCGRRSGVKALPKTELDESWMERILSNPGDQFFQMPETTKAAQCAAFKMVGPVGLEPLCGA